MIIGMKKSFFPTYKQAIEYVSVICSQRMGNIKVGCKRDKTLKNLGLLSIPLGQKILLKERG